MAKPEDLHAIIERKLEAIAEISPGHGGSEAKIARLHSEIFVVASQLAEISSRRLERQTQQLIYLTWAVVALTFVLLLFTAYLTYDVYLQRQRHQQTQPHATQQYDLYCVHAA